MQLEKMFNISKKNESKQPEVLKCYRFTSYDYCLTTKKLTQNI